jgi:hypothetical protein
MQPLDDSDEAILMDDEDFFGLNSMSRAIPPQALRESETRAIQSLRLGKIGVVDLSVNAQTAGNVVSC